MIEGCCVSDKLSGRNRIGRIHRRIPNLEKKGLPEASDAVFAPVLEDAKDGCRRLFERARCKESEASHGVLITFQNVLGPTLDKL